MELDMVSVVEAAARTNTMLEINASWQRLDLKDLHIRQALAAGVVLTLNTDAYSTGGLQQMRYGVMTARRGGTAPKNVVNSLPLPTLRRRLSAKP